MVLSWFKTPQGPTSPSNVLAVSIVLPVLCVVAVAFRFNARLLQKNSLKLDDWLTVPALLFVIGMAVCTIIGINRCLSFTAFTEEFQAFTLTIWAITPRQ